jgi:hypothetical protein
MKHHFLIEVLSEQYWYLTQFEVSVCGIIYSTENIYK